MSNVFRLLAAAACFVGAAPVSALAANIVVEWNATAISTALAAGQGPVPQTRSIAIVSVAVNDAVNAISRRYPTYAPPDTPPSQASVDAAAAGAAYHALTVLYPAHASSLASALSASLAAHGISASDPAIAF